MQVKKKPDIKQILSLALFLALIALLCVYVYRNRIDMQKLLELNAQTVVLLLVLALGGCVVNCVYHKIILNTYHIPLSLSDWMGVVFVANAIAYVLPLRADLVFSAAYYKRTKGLAYVKSVSMAAGNIIFGVIFALLQMLAALVCIGLIDHVWSVTLWALWCISALCMTGFIILSLVFQEHQLKFLRKYKLLSDVINGFNALLRNRQLLWQLLICLTVNNLIHLLLYMTCFHAIGIETTIYQALFYNSVSWLASIVAIVPGNLGIKEGVMGVATRLMGTLFANGVAVSLLQRVAIMIVYIAMGLVFALPVWKKWNRNPPLNPMN